MAFVSLEDAVFNSKSLADPAEYVMQAGNPNQLFSDRHGGMIGLLHYMVMVKSKEGVSLMLDIGADPNLRSSDDSTPLWAAMIVNHFEIIQLLVEMGADVNVREKKRGDTPLHAALVEGRKDIAQYLLDHGADPDARNNLGISPKQLDLFDKLKHETPSPPDGGLDQWLEALGDTPSEEDLMNFLELCQALLHNMVQQGRLSRIKAQMLERKIDEFKETEKWPQSFLSTEAIKIQRMREIIDELKTTFTEDLSR